MDLKEIGWRVLTVSIRFRIGDVMIDSCKHGNEPSGSKEGGEFLE